MELDRLSNLPWVPCSVLWEMLSARDLAALNRTNRQLHCNVESFLYRRHGLGHGPEVPSAVMWAVETADLDEPETCKLALAVLDKVKQFCCLDHPGALDCPYITKKSQDICEGRRGLLADRWRGTNSSPTALQLAAWKGLDAIIEWLLDCGADVNFSIFPICFESRFGSYFHSFNVNPLYLAVWENRMSTASLLLSRGANPVFPRAGSPVFKHSTVAASSGRTLTVLHLACAKLYPRLAEQLLASGSVPADPTDVLQWYSRNRVWSDLLLDNGNRPSSDIPEDDAAIVKLLARGADVSYQMIYDVLFSPRWNAALALIQAAKSGGKQISGPEAAILLDRVRLAAGLCRDGTELTHEFVLLNRQLLEMGARPDIKQAPLQALLTIYDIPAVSHKLTSLLELAIWEHRSDRSVRLARMNSEHKYALRRLRQWTEYDPWGASASQSDSWQAAQLEAIRLVLRYGVIIDPVTRSDALDIFGRRGTAREKWYYKLCGALVEHCREIHPDALAREDRADFLYRLSKRNKRLGARAFEIDDLVSTLCSQEID
ncbi:hypothetical protein QBC37DRAFT_463749 [Rhypophila decipiens]|uniref:Uncharacterized protein n=1 Tax=Rhypophila decipiens TaxID=261697 RepID=A0AAN6YBE5_9PEZI|nr:hypothetical protein QBC37DRAFT_463749 [Rhypophila decipiens]